MPRKRSASDNGDADDDDEPRNGRSGSNVLSASGQSKRSRTSQDDVNESDNEDAMNVEEDELNGDDEEEEDDEGGGIVPPVNGGGMEAEMGVIEKVNLTNFMCHDRLEIKLGPKLNFVIGHNGSGKSAILTGITIALGGKATATSRGNSLKSFVKEGKQSAIVEVTLKNTGPEAFKPHLYHDKIIIERTIRADGTGSWKIKNALDRVVSLKREELNAICDHANIQVDNPMNILTQDSARHFLSASHSDDKYQFFLRGTQLAQLASEFDIAQHNITRIRNFVASGEESLPALAEKAREANSLLEVIQRARTQKDRIDILRREVVWAFVQELEDEVETVLERVERMRLKREKAEAERDRCEEEEKKHEATITELENRANENINREAPLLAEIKSLRESEKEYHRKIMDAKQEESTLNEQYKRLKTQIDNLNKRIETETRKAKDGNHEKRTALLNQQRQADLEKKKLEREEAEQRDLADEYEREMMQNDREINQLESKREHLRNTVANADSQIAKLRKAKKNRMTAFGTNIPTLLQLIDRETRWRQKPIGPIGAHLKLKDGRWAPVLESVIGNTLNAFCVTNHQDRTLLQDLKRRANCGDVTILTGSDEAFDYSSGEPEPHILTILRVLQIESDYLTRQLINSVHIEQSALVTARADGDRLMRQGVMNVKTCFSMDMYRLGGGNVGSSTQTLQMHHGPPRLSLDIEVQLQEVQQRRAEAEEELRKITRELESFQVKKSAAMEGRKDCRLKIPHLQRQARQKHAEMERIDEELREDEPTNISALTEAKKDSELEQEKIQEKFQDVHERIELNEKEMQPLTEAKLAIKSKVEIMQEQGRTLKPKLEEAAKSRLQAHRDADHYKADLAKIIAKEEDLSTSAKSLENDLQRRTAKAEEQCERVPTEKSSKEYEKEIEAVEQQVLATTREHGQDPEAIIAMVRQCSADFQKAQANIELLNEVKRDLETAIRIRLAKWRRFRRNISVRAKGAFASYLNNRGYTGNIIFDHNKGTLKLIVQTEENGGGGGAGHDKDPKSLSGGEKSFATICLLLALWESIGCPIRCLDEFDVFMDAVNRRISMSMMIDAARGANGVQYVLITPQAMSNVQFGSDVRVHRLNDPERNQTTLNMG